MDPTTRQSAIEAVYKLAYALDALDKLAFERLLPVDGTFVFDISAILGNTAKNITADEYYEFAMNSIAGFDATQHLVGCPLVTSTRSDEAHVEAMVLAFHGLARQNGFEGATARVSWHIDLKLINSSFCVTKWVVKNMTPMDNPAIFQEGHRRAQEGKLRPGLTGA